MLQAEPDLASLMGSPAIAAKLAAAQAGLRSCVARAAAAGVAVPVLSAALSYFDAMRRERCTANLTQVCARFLLAARLCSGVAIGGAGAQASATGGLPSPPVGRQAAGMH